MVSALVINQNTYVSQDEANAYLGDSIRAGNWEYTGSATKDKCLISAWRTLEQLLWAGDPTGVQSSFSATVSSGGTGYAVNDELTVDGGTFGDPAVYKVTAASGGVVSAVQSLNGGTYTQVPTNPVATTGGGGTGCTLDLSFSNQFAAHPRTGLKNCDSEQLDSDEVAQEVKNAQMELAYDYSLDPALESSPNTSSNTKKLGAGSAQIEFFRPESGTPIPQAAYDWIKCLTGASLSGPTAGTGSETCSQFGTDDQSNLSEGYP